MLSQRTLGRQLSAAQPSGRGCVSGLRAAGASRRSSVAVRASGVRARWCIDVEYGHKQTVTTLLQEWVTDVGARAGLTHTNTRLSSGSVGVAESRLELEVTFTSLSEWEHFLGNIPAKEHKAWSQRVQGMIVGGSPRWELYRAVPAFADGQEHATAAAPVARPVAAAPVLALPSSVLAMQAALQQSRPTASSASASSSVSDGDAGGNDGAPGDVSRLSIIDNAADAEVVLDWKGDPLKINPGDKLPFKFL
ncbi:hypothetical protein HXX76_003875 [Chlamydomonas incerta]|uniref:Uncharacterized protein n=1 Tax=Chlamydomonas incerta TaxID=51695 RepID=A0A835T8T5_CHLIN|nr:hypothetical protein HXX76_003875 [Chlamydomonas incerta]|eukprot:KAG2441022.1 hypothetical protein HXX76_003875 [Chlamydomonas incerta]